MPAAQRFLAVCQALACSTLGRHRGSHVQLQRLSNMVIKKGRVTTMTVLASPMAANSSYSTAVFGLVGVLIGAVVAGGVSLWTANKTRKAAERAWVRDNRRTIYDRFLTCGQTLLVVCEDARKADNEGAATTVNSADVKFWEAYSVLLTVADSELANAART
jgi:hypothetical protein